MKMQYQDKRIYNQLIKVVVVVVVYVYVYM